MLTNPDFKELLKIFEKRKIRYLVVGGYAVMKYSEPRFTKDKEASGRPQDKIDIKKLKEAEQLDALNEK
jgi:hypothetical protein